jgi:hypothetical protein
MVFIGLASLVAIGHSESRSGAARRASSILTDREPERASEWFSEL